MKHRTALLTVENYPKIYQMDKSERGNRNDGTLAPHSEYTEEEDAVMFFVVFENTRKSSSISQCPPSYMEACRWRKTLNCFHSVNSWDWCYINLDRSEIDTCASEPSVIVNIQYPVFYDTFTLPYIINLLENPVMTRIDGSRTPLTVIMIHVPFKYLVVNIDLSVSVIKDCVSTLL